MRDFNGNGGTDSGAYDIAKGAFLIFDGNRTLTEAASVAGEGIVRTGANSTGTTTIMAGTAMALVSTRGHLPDSVTVLFANALGSRPRSRSPGGASRGIGRPSRSSSGWGCGRSATRPNSSASRRKC